MDRIIKLLQEKNHYLEKFFSLNERQMVDIIDGHYDGLEAFYKNREKILDMIQYLDREIDRESSALKFTPKVAAEQKKAMELEFRVKKQYVDKILDQDLKLISLIESAKSGIIEELNKIKKGRAAVSGYKAPVF